MKRIFLLCLFLVTTGTWAQQFSISGKVVDAETQEPLESATLFVEKVQDSSLVNYTISNRTGDFIIEGSQKVDSLRLVSSFNGYNTFSRLVVLDDERKIDLGLLQMEVANNMLGEVTVISERAPVTIKSDTLEFNAGSFNTRQDANLEEVMKKLPGVEVDAQGNITVNGKPVSRILVNGKEFFGNDPKIATKNLPKEIIDKIQVVDTKTKTEEFTGKAGNPDDKTINITIKKDKNKGYFARATAGGGTDERYELSGIGNYFNEDLRVSVLASSNNINSSGFSFDEVYDAMGGRARSISFNRNGNFSINGNSFGGSGGITKSETAGINFSNDWDKKYELTGDYFFGKNDTETRSIVQRETFLPTRTFITNSTSAGNLVNESHRANAAFEVEIDTLTKISVRPSVNINSGFSNRARTSERIEGENEILSSTFDDEELSSSNFRNRLNFIRRFGSRGAYLQLNFENQNDKRESENFFYSERINLEGNEVTETDIQDQFIDEDSETDEYEAGITQRSVLAEKLFLDLSYSFSVQNLTNTRMVYEMDDATGNHSIFNQALSNDFEVTSYEHIPNAGINYEGQKWRVGFNLGLLNTSLENENYIAESSFKNSYNNLFVSSNLRYEMARGKSMYLHYRTNNNIPSITQLQPVPIITDPLNIIVGNPELRPTYTQSLNLGYHNFDFATRSGVSVYASASFHSDQVVSYSQTGEDLITTTTYRNLDGGLSSFAGASYSKRYKKEKQEFNYRAGLSGSYNRQVGFSNGFRYSADRYGLNPSVRLGYNYEEVVELNPRYELNYVNTQYDINNNREEEYVNHTVGFEATSYWPRNVVFGNDISFNSFGNVAPGFDSTALLWNMSLGYKFLNDDATIKLKVYDLLNENVSTTRTTGDDFVQDTQELILEQYFMLSFTYKLSKFGGNAPQRRGGIIRM